jgi:hypothetical protein
MVKTLDHEATYEIARYFFVSRPNILFRLRLLDNTLEIILFRYRILALFYCVQRG